MSFVVPRMNAEQSRAWLALLSTSHLLPAALDQQLTDDAGIINFEYGILSILGTADGRTLRIGELVDALSAPYPRVSKAVSRLESRGLVERVACAGDGRAINVHLTRAGRQTWLKATPPHLELAREGILGGLSPEQLTQLAELLEPIVQRLNPDSSLCQIGREDPPKG